jgi:hypothetical protein
MNYSLESTFQTTRKLENILKPVFPVTKKTFLLQKKKGFEYQCLVQILFSKLQQAKSFFRTKIGLENRIQTILKGQKYNFEGLEVTWRD